MTLKELYRQSLQALPLILRGLCREKRLSPEELEDLRSDIQIKLLEDDYRVLRRWNRRSSFKVYLETVVYNIWHDRVRGEKGNVRVSAAAKRLGPPAPELEMLLGRQGLTLDEAYQVIKPRFPGLSRGEAQKIADQINPRPGRSFKSEDDEVSQLRDLEPPADKRLEQREKLLKKHKALAFMRQRLSELPEQDCLLLMRVHAEGVKFSHIAKSLGGIDQRSLYRRNERLITKLRIDLEEAGIRWQDLSEVLGIDDGEYCLGPPSMIAVTKSCGTPSAAFLDGSLLRGERDWIVSHLNRCPDCFERYIGAARLLDAIEEEEASALSAADGNRAVEPSLLRSVESFKKLPKRSWRLVWLLQLSRLAVPILQIIGSSGGFSGWYRRGELHRQVAAMRRVASRPAEALKLALLACRIVELAGGSHPWRLRLQGYAVGNVALVLRVNNDLLAAEAEFARARRLRDAGAAGDPGLTRLPHFAR